MRIKLLLPLFLLFFCSILNTSYSQIISNKKTVVPTGTEKVTIRVFNIANGQPLKDVEIINEYSDPYYTNNNGIVVLNDILPESNISFKLNGFVSEVRKAKSTLIVNLYPVEIDDADKTINFGYYKRAIDHISNDAVSFSGNDLRKASSGNILDALSVLEPGISVRRDNMNGSDPNVASSLQIRGTKFFPAAAAIANGKNQNGSGVQINPSSGDFIASRANQQNLPLILLNGAEISLQHLADLDINMIDNVTILKDAASAFSYGSRAANGVILVRTLSGKKGVYNIFYSTQMQIASADLSSYNLMNATEKLQLEQTAGLYNVKNQSLLTQRLAGVNAGINTNWLKEPLQTGFGQKHSLQLSGGNDVVTYGVNFGYSNTEGVMKGTGRTIADLNMVVGGRFRNLNILTTLYYTNTVGKNSVIGKFKEYTALNPYWTPFDKYGAVTKNLEESHYSAINGSDSAVYYYNPLYNGSISTKNSTQYYKMGVNTVLDFKIGNGFSLNGRLSAFKTSDQTDLFFPPGNTLFANFTPDMFFKRGSYNQTNSMFTTLAADITGNYSKQFGKHYIYATIGSSAVTTQSESTLTSVIGFTSNQLSDISFGASYASSNPTAGKINTSLLSSFINLTYSYDNRYQIEAGFSRDGSSNFSENNRFSNYHAVSASWNIHNEHFFKPNNLISQFKIKAGFGVVGSNSFPAYLANTSMNYFTNQLYTGAISTTGPIGFYMLGIGNKNLESPKIYNQNIGTDIVLFKNRLNIKATLYNEQSRNLVLPITTPGYSGITNTNYYENCGEIDNKGIELAVSGVFFQNKEKNHTLIIGISGTHNVNQIKSISNYVEQQNLVNNSFNVDQTQPQPLYVVGKSINTLWAVQSAGIDPSTGIEMFKTASETLTSTWNSADKIAVGTTDPDWFGAISINYVMKQISVGAYINYSFGASVYNQTLADKIENANLNYNTDRRAIDNRWAIANGTNILYKKLVLNGLVTNPTYCTTRFVEKEHVFNAASLSMGYTFKDNPLRSKLFHNTSIFFYGNNLLYLSNVKQERGIYYPVASNFVLKLTTSFR